MVSAFKSDILKPVRAKSQTGSLIEAKVGLSNPCEGERGHIGIKDETSGERKDIEP